MGVHFRAHASALNRRWTLARCSKRCIDKYSGNAQQNTSAVKYAECANDLRTRASPPLFRLSAHLYAVPERLNSNRYRDYARNSNEYL